MSLRSYAMHCGAREPAEVMLSWFEALILAITGVVCHATQARISED